MEFETKIQANRKYFYINLPQVLSKTLRISKGDIAKIELTKRKELKIRIERGFNDT